jgi:hypothetical protein
MAVHDKSGFCFCTRIAVTSVALLTQLPATFRDGSTTWAWAESTPAHEISNTTNRTLDKLGMTDLNNSLCPPIPLSIPPRPIRALR